MTHGYNQRALGYSCVHDNFTSTTAFNCAKELTREHVPLLADIIPAGSNHIVIVCGYREVSTTENYLSVFDPNNYGNPDTHQIGQDWWRWETDAGQPDTRHNFGYYWSLTSYLTMLVAPLPVELNLTYTSSNEKMNFGALVRTCWPFPTADTGDTAWESVNLGKTLSGHPVNSAPLEIVIAYPATLSAPIGANPHTFTPGGADASTSVGWSFDASDPDIYGATLSVRFSGWARQFNSSNYTNQTDELGGSASFTLDKRLFQIQGADATVVGALGDEGNLYLGGSLREFEDAISADSGMNELYIRHSEGNIAGMFAEDGSGRIAGLAHWNMNDVNDSCTGAMTDASNDSTATATRLPISDYTRLPANPSATNFYVRIHNEIMRVTDSGPNYGAPTDNRDFLTVVRGQLGTTTVGHECGSQVWLYAKGDLVSAIDSSQTTFALETGDAAMFPSVFLLARRFPIQISNEYMLVIAVSQDTFTVERGWKESTAVPHSMGADVRLAPELVYDEQHHLSCSAEHTFRIQNDEGETVAYIDAKGEMRLRGCVFEHFTGWGLWQ